MLTSSVFYWATYLFRSCKQNDHSKADKVNQKFSEGWCPKGYYDPLATIFFADEAEVIRNIMSNDVSNDTNRMWIFLACWYFMTIITYGVSIPAGLFLPGMIIGCAIGQLYAQILLDTELIHKPQFDEVRKNCIIIGIGATLAGYTRMTYSLAVIVMETSQVINMFVPLMISIMISN
jgi:chloride channel 7